MWVEKIWEIVIEKWGLNSILKGRWGGVKKIDLELIVEVKCIENLVNKDKIIFNEWSIF